MHIGKSLVYKMLIIVGIGLLVFGWMLNQNPWAFFIGFALVFTGLIISG